MELKIYSLGSTSGEYDLWLMRIEQYFLMTDYSLWEVIKNGNKVLTKTVGTVEQPHEPTTVEEKLDRKNEMKAKGTLLMALTELDRKNEMKARGSTKVSFIPRCKIAHGSYREVHKQHNEADNTTYGVSIAHTQGNTVYSTSVDNLSDVVICAFLVSQPNSLQLAREDLEQIDHDDLEEMDLHWEMAMLTIRARRAQKNQENREREYGRKMVLVVNPTENSLIAQDGIGGYDWSYQVEEEHPTNFALMALTSLGSSSNLDFKGVCSTIETKPAKKNNFSLPIIEDQISDEESKKEYKEKGVMDSGCSRHMRGNKLYLTDYEDYDGGFVSFGDGKGRISRKGKIKTRTLDFDEVYFWIKREFSVARTPQQNGVAKRMNRTLIEATSTNRLHKTLWVSCYHLKYMDYLGKFDKKADEGFFMGYSMVSKAMRVFNKRTRIVEETLNIRSFENAPNVKGSRPGWLFDIDSLKISMNYVPIVVGFQTNGLKDSVVDARKKATEVDESQVSKNGGLDDEVTKSEFEGILQQERQNEHINSTKSFNTVSSPVSIARPSFANAASPSLINVAGTPASINAFEEYHFERFSPFKNAFSLPYVPIVTLINDIGIFCNAYDDEVVEEEVDMNNVVPSYTIPNALLTKFLKDHPKDQAIGTKWVFRNKKDDRGMVIKNKTRLVAQGHTQEEGINYDEVFSPVARIKAIRLFLAYTSFKDFVVYQMDVNSAFLYGKIKEEVYVCQPPGFEDPNFPNKVYKVEKALYGLHQAPRACFSTVKTTSTLMEPNKALVKDAEAEDVDMHLYRSMIRSLMYLTASRPDITFVVCAYARFQVTLKTSHLHAVKRIFRFLKGQPKLGLWYPKDSPFDLEAYSDSDYVGASLDKKSITEEDRMERAATTASSLEVEQDSAKVKKVNGQEHIQALVDKQKVIITQESIRRDLKFNDTEVEGMAKHKEICVISSHTKKIFANIKRQGQGFSRNVTPLFETMMVTAQEEIAEVHSPSSKILVEESIATPSNDPLPSEEAKIAQAKEIAKLKKIVKKVENRRKSRPARLRRLKKVGSKIALVDEAQGRMHDADMFGIDDLEGNEVFVDVREQIFEKEVTTTDEVVTTANVEDSHAPTTATTADDKGKAKIIEPEKPLKKKDQIALDEEVAQKLEAKMRAEIEEEERITREKDKANRAVDDDDDVAIEATPLSFKSPTIVEYKIYREWEKSDRGLSTLFKLKGKWSLICAGKCGGGDGESCCDGDGEDLEVLRSIVKERFKKTKPVDDMENLLFQTLKTMFEPHVEDIV
uniref:Retrovirus-related Pol polyprotein from transposon TNT 1-94 n=1 Tax=Tanacetum cinerariifolium TaxID=118510 RepID=A0A6L2NDN4_TANCI|nr:retrovirus-related Pol polyprotein from transposon TNT 1-94 [Tanacetum cinerariifolium]